MSGITGRSQCGVSGWRNMTKKTIAIAAIGICASYRMRYKRKNRSKWVKTWSAKRNTFGHMPLIRELKTNEPRDFKNYLRMTESSFNHLLGLLRPHLTKQDTIMRKSIPAEERLIATLRFLATGSSYEDLKFSTGIAAQTLGYIIPDTCKIIYESLKNHYLKMPHSKKEWTEVAQGFKDRWHVINCGGCIDGKHIRIVAPATSGAMYYNYKNFYSIVLMAVVNSNYEFIYVDVGKQGRFSDGGVFQRTSFYKRLVDETLGLPEPHENEEGFNFMFIGDEASALDEHILKPYAQRVLNYERRVYNYRIARARNVVENAFGLIASVFRILHTSINVKPQNINYIVLAICTLHNFLRKNSASYNQYFDTENTTTHEFEPGTWRNDVDIKDVLLPLQTNSRKNYVAAAKHSRDEYLQFFNGKGKIPWQDDMIKKGKA